MRTERLYALSSELSRVMLPQAVVRAGSAALEALTASVVLVSADGKAFELRAAHGFPQGALRGFERFPSTRR